jgi:hypothetical protein
MPLMILLLSLCLVGSAQAATTYFSANHDAGNMNEWTAAGGNIFRDGLEPLIVASQDQAHNGTWSAKFDIPDPQVGGSSQKTLRWSFPAGPGSGPGGGLLEAYFSAWYWFGPTFMAVNNTHWHNNMQWMSNRSGGGNVIVHLQPSTRNTVFQLQVINWACEHVSHPNQTTCPIFSGYTHFSPNNGHVAQTTPIALPREQWVQIEVYYKAARTNGHVKVWQNGTLIFDLSAAGYNTIDSNVNPPDTSHTQNCADPGHDEPCYSDVMWGINNYLDPTAPNNQLLYADQVIVSSEQQSVGSSPPAAPTNLRIINP